MRQGVLAADLVVQGVEAILGFCLLSTSLIVFVVVYFAVFGTGISYMLKLIAKGPDEMKGGYPLVHQAGQSLRPARPLSAAPDDIDPAIELADTKKE
jgi:cytochrome d ubiquinol oxidase subunit I